MMNWNLCDPLRFLVNLCEIAITQCDAEIAQSYTEKKL